MIGWRLDSVKKMTLNKNEDHKMSTPMGLSYHFKQWIAEAASIMSHPYKIF